MDMLEISSTLTITRIQRHIATMRSFWCLLLTIRIYELHRVIANPFQKTREDSGNPWKEKKSLS